LKVDCLLAWSRNDMCECVYAALLLLVYLFDRNVTTIPPSLILKPLRLSSHCEMRHILNSSHSASQPYDPTPRLTHSLFQRRSLRETNLASLASDHFLGPSVSSSPVPFVPDSESGRVAAGQGKENHRPTAPEAFVTG
jgi:hypothetical protein